MGDFSSSRDFSPLRGSRVRENVDKTPPKLFLLTGLAILGGFLFGYDTGVVSGAFLLVRREMHLTDTWHELIVSATIAAALITALISGEIADRIGRRPTILLASLVFGLGSTLMSVAAGKITLLIGRIFVGIGVGFASSVVPLYIGECSTAELRGVLVAVNIVAVTAGQLVAGLCCGAFLYVPSGWRLMLGLATIPAILQLVGFYFMPESPRYLVKKGKYSEAETVLASIRSPYHQIQDELEDIRIACSSSAQNQDLNLSFRHFIMNFMSDRHARKSVALGCLLQFCQQFAGINTIMYYAASIIKMTGASDEMSIWFSCIFAGINFVFSIVGLKLVELLTRRKLLLFSLCGVIFSLLSTSVSFQILGDNNTNSSSNHSNIDNNISDTFYANTDSFAGEILVLMSIAVYIAAFAPGLGPLPWAINSELHPTWCRAQAQALATSVNWMANLIVSMTFLSLVAALGRPLTFLLYAIVTFICTIMLAWKLPETKGVSLENVSSLFTPSAPTPKSGDVMYSLMPGADEDDN